jgi:AcrR family transcriptional regulator
MPASSSRNFRLRPLVPAQLPRIGFAGLSSGSLQASLKLLVDRPNKVDESTEHLLSQAQNRKRSLKPGATRQDEAQLGDTRSALLRAVHDCLHERGYAGLSTRQVAERAGVPLSQIHYHFGSKRGLIVALLEGHDRRLIARQEETFALDVALSERWDLACSYLDQDIESGYVLILQEMIAAGWSDPELAAAARAILAGWSRLLVGLARDAGKTYGGLGPFSPEEVGALVAAAFLGSEAMILLGFESDDVPVRSALRRFGDLIRQREAIAERRGR